MVGDFLEIDLESDPMEKSSNINTAEKQRLRESIAEQVRNFLEGGGNIDVVEHTPSRNSAYRGSIWDNADPTPLLD